MNRKALAVHCRKEQSSLFKSCSIEHKGGHGRHEGSCCRLRQKSCVVHTEAMCSRVVWWVHVSRTKSQHLHKHEMLRVHVPGICCSDMSPRVNCYFYNCATPTNFGVILSAPRRVPYNKFNFMENVAGTNKITPKLVLRNHKSISSHEGTFCCNISLGHIYTRNIFMCLQML